MGRRRGTGARAVSRCPRTELAKLLSENLIEVGAHTVSHPSMPRSSAADLEREVVASRHDCEALTGRAASGFAYPFGDHDTASTAAVRAAGFTHAVPL